jgi:hypothetical protein
MGALFQAIHPVEYSRPIPQAMAEELIQPGGLGSLLCILFTDDPGGSAISGTPSLPLTGKGACASSCLKKDTHTHQ